VNGVRTAMRGIGQTLITFGVVILLFCAYELWFTNLYTSREQSHLKHELDLGDAPPPIGAAEFPPLLNGHAIALLYIPRLGRGYVKAIVEGISVDDLKKGPGHWPKSALPGQVGNFVVSGHRTTYGAPFNRLDEVRPGDAIVIETRTTWYVYRETSESKVSPNDVAVTYPVPNQPGARPTKPMLTFTTCHPKYSARQRLIMFAQLETTQPRTAGGAPPAALGGTG
jgi:sortase A